MKRRVALSLFALAAACGTRTGLLGDEGELATPDAAAPVDASQGPRDAALDAPADAPFDALPPIDGNRPDVVPPDICPDAAATFIYLLTRANALMSFDPATNAVRSIGTIKCPTPSQPWSMAVARNGIAYSVFDDGHVFRIDTRDAACGATTFAPGQQGWLTFGMGFVADVSGPGETLFVAESQLGTGRRSLGLGTLDTSTFTLNYVAGFSPPIVPRAELTGTAAGRLYAFWINDTGSGSNIAEIDRTNAKVLGIDRLKSGVPNAAYAFAYWGGDFYTFTATDVEQTTHVVRFRPSDKSEVEVTKIPGIVVGAGVSTCAPQ